MKQLVLLTIFALLCSTCFPQLPQPGPRCPYRQRLIGCPAGGSPPPTGPPPAPPPIGAPPNGDSPPKSGGPLAAAGQITGGGHHTPALPPMAYGSATAGSASMPSGFSNPSKPSVGSFADFDATARMAVIYATDMDYSSNGVFGLTVSRQYIRGQENYSDNTYGRTMLGPGWIMNWEIRLEQYIYDVAGDYDMYLRTPEGACVDFIYVSTDKWIADPNIMAAVLTHHTDANPANETWDLKFAAGDGNYRFDYYGNLTYIEDRNGNRLTCSYDTFSSTSLLTRVTASSPDSRYLSFEYNSPTNGADPRTSRLNKVSCSWSDRAVKYFYTDNQLSDVKDNWDREVEQYGWVLNYDSHDYFSVNRPDANGTMHMVNLWEFEANNGKLTAKYDGAGTKLIWADESSIGHTNVVRDAQGHAIYVGDYFSHTYVPTSIEYYQFPPTIPGTANTASSASYVRTDRQSLRTAPVIGSANGTMLPLGYSRNGEAQTTFTYYANYNGSDPSDFDFSRVYSQERLGKSTIYYAYDTVTSRPAGWIIDYPGRWAGQTFDANGNVKEQVFNGDYYTTYTVDTYGRVVTKQSQTGTTTYYHDGIGNIRAIVDEEGRMHNFDYDTTGRLTAKGYLGTTTTLSYGAYDLCTTVTDAIGDKTVYAYDALDRVTTVTDPLGNKTVYDYSPTSWTLTSVTNGAGGKIKYTYDPYFRLRTLTDERDKLTSYTYDYQGRLATETNPLLKTCSYTYDDLGGSGCSCGSTAGAGQLASKTDQAGRTTYYTYDSADRLTTTTYSSSSDKVVNSFDTYGRITSRKDNRLSSTDFPNQAFTYAYNSWDQLTSVTYPDNATVQYGYDAAHRRTSLTDPDSNITSYHYATAADCKQLDWIDTPLSGSTKYFYYHSETGLPWSTRTWIYVGAWQVTGEDFWYGDMNRLETIGLSSDYYSGYFLLEATTFNANSMRSAIDYTSWDIFFPDYYKSYSYDAARRLTQEHKKLSSNDSNLNTYDYTNDAAGNRTQMINYNGSSTATTTYAYNDFNQLTSSTLSATATQYYYDDNGNMNRRSQGADYNYTHDRSNHLASYDIEGDQVVNYTYDASGRLLMREASNGTKEKYYYDGINRLMVKEKLSGGVWRTKKINVLKQAEIGQIVAHREYTAWSGSTPTAYNDRYYHYDQLGNVTSLTDNFGQATDTYDMEAFGNVLSGGQAGVHLTTKEWDADAGLYYFNARWYSVGASQWLQREPFGLDGPNLYRFVKNCPLCYVDPSGLLGWDDIIEILLHLLECTTAGPIDEPPPPPPPPIIYPHKEPGPPDFTTNGPAVLPLYPGAPPPLPTPAPDPQIPEIRPVEW